MRKFFYYIFSHPFYKIKLGALGTGSKLHQAVITGGKNIYIGQNVYIRRGGWLAADARGIAPCRLSIGDGTYIGNYCHIYATNNIGIGNKVLIADRVYISDNVHSYENVNVPVIDQPIKQLPALTIGDGAWLGENVCVIGASVGKNSVVGANAVVTRDIPDYCVALGIPAIIVKRYNFKTGSWCKTDNDGSFI